MPFTQTEKKVFFCFTKSFTLPNRIRPLLKYSWGFTSASNFGGGSSIQTFCSWLFTLKHLDVVHKVFDGFSQYPNFSPHCVYFHKAPLAAAGRLEESPSCLYPRPPPLQAEASAAAWRGLKTTGKIVESLKVNYCLGIMYPEICPSN